MNNIVGFILISILPSITGLSQVITINNCCSLRLPSDLEVQSGSWKSFTDHSSKSLGIEYDSNELWLQQKGLNAYDTNSRNYYIRIGISTIRTPYATSQDPREELELTDADLADFDVGFNKEINNYRFTKVITIDKSVIAKVGMYFAIKKSFISQAHNSPVKKSERYVIFYNSHVINIKVEYWIKDYEKYKKSIKQVLNSLRLI